MQINKDVINILKANKITTDTGLLYLLGLHFKLDTAVIPDDIKAQIHAANVVNRDYKSETIEWNVSLFEGQETAFSWVDEWRAGFKQRNADRAGNKKFCVKRMKDFFAANPEVRKEDVIEATEMYFLSVKDNQYLKSADKFIAEGNAAVKKSMLEQYLEKVFEERKTNTINVSQEGRKVY